MTNCPPHITDVGELLDNFVAQIPGQDQHEVGFGLTQLIFSHDRYPCAGQEAALLVWRGINDRTQQITAYPGEIEQGVAFGGGTVADDDTACAALIEQEP